MDEIQRKEVHDKILKRGNFPKMCNERLESHVILMFFPYVLLLYHGGSPILETDGKKIISFYSRKVDSHYKMY
jgi:hypothetical protein